MVYPKPSNYMKNSKKSIKYDGTIEYFNKNGLFHNENGPARIYGSIWQEYRITGQLHRENGPAVIDSDMGNSWYIDGNHIK